MKRYFVTLLFLGVLALCPVLPAQAQTGASLHLAALTGDVETASALAGSGADLDARDAYGSTPLTIAITFGRAEVAKLLIRAGADLALTDGTGSAPLHLAAFFGHSALVEALIEGGADLQQRNGTGATAQDIVTAPFDADRPTYDAIAAALAPLGLQLDYAAIAAARPGIADILQRATVGPDNTGFAPLALNDDWRLSDPASEGLNPALVETLYAEAAALPTLKGLLIVKNRALVAEGYFNGAKVDDKTLTQSVTKSWISASVGLALREGCIDSLDQPLLAFFPEFEGRVTDARKRDITLRQMLQMRSGLPWEELDPALWDELIKGDNLHLLADIPLANDPGAGFNYSNFTANLLAQIVARACKTDLRHFAETHLASPIGASFGEWWQDSDGYRYPLLEVSARDNARFGLLYLDKGVWQGQHVLPADWVAASLANYSDDAWITTERSDHAGRHFRDLGYGYQWWSADLGGERLNFAWGHGGQLIVLHERLNMVVVAVADPLWQEHNPAAWQIEQSVLNLVGKFLVLLNQG